MIPVAIANHGLLVIGDNDHVVIANQGPEAVGDNGPVVIAD